MIENIIQLLMLVAVISLVILLGLRIYVYYKPRHIRVFKRMVMVLLILGAGILVFIVYDHSSPAMTIDQNKSMILCNNGKSFPFSKYNDNTWLSYGYECSSLVNEISLEEYKANYTRNYIDQPGDKIKCNSNGMIFKTDTPDHRAAGYSMLYNQYLCAEYGGTSSFEEYRENYWSYKISRKSKLAESPLKNIIYTTLTTILLILFFIIKFRKLENKFPIYLRSLIILVEISCIVAVTFYVAVFTGVIRLLWLLRPVGFLWINWYYTLIGLYLIIFIVLLLKKARQKSRK